MSTSTRYVAGLKQREPFGMEKTHFVPIRLAVTPFWGGEVRKRCVQLDIEDQYIQLSSEGISQLQTILAQLSKE